MKNPSHLVKNRYGVYYYCIVFPASIRKIINKQQARRSLRTKNRAVALLMVREFQKTANWLFDQIRYNDMKWIEAKKILDKTADDLFKKYVERVHEAGFTFRDEDSLYEVMPLAENFLFPIDNRPHFEYDEENDIATPIYPEDFENRMVNKKEVTALVDDILGANNVKIKKNSKEYSDFCRQTLEMLYRLDKQKAVYRNKTMLGEPETTGINRNETATVNGPSIPLQELIDKYINHKVVIEKKWSERTIKGYKENLGRIYEMFVLVTGQSNPDIGTLTREHARNVRETLALNKRGFGKLTGSQESEPLSFQVEIAW